MTHDVGKATLWQVNQTANRNAVARGRKTREKNEKAAEEAAIWKAQRAAARNAIARRKAKIAAKEKDAAKVESVSWMSLWFGSVAEI